MLSLSHQSRLFSEFKSITLEKWSRSNEGLSTKGRILEATRLGDRRGIIDAVSELIPECKLQAGYYESKKEARALELLEGGNLTEALAWAPTTSKLFGLILGRRIRHYYDSGELERCSRDCSYMLERRRPDTQQADDQPGDDQLLIIEALIFHANCSKAMGEPGLARAKLNEAMRRINEIAVVNNNNADPASRLKAQILQSCLLAKSAPGPTRNSMLVLTAPATAAPPPPVAGKPHPFLSSCSDAVALSHDRARGRFLYAKRNIKPGSVLIVDRPFSFSTDITALHSNCANCHLSFRLANVVQIPCQTCATIRYCSEGCSTLAWDRFHKYECQIFKYFYESDLQKCNALLAYRTVVRAFFQFDRSGRLTVNEDFVRLHENDMNVIDLMSMKKYEPDNYETVFSLKTHCIYQQLKENLENAIHSIFLAKCLVYSSTQLGLDFDNSGKLETVLAVAFLHNIQAIKCNAYEIVENVRDEATKVLEPRNIGGAIYPTVSLTNHSCYPNIVRHCFYNGVVAVTSLRFIPEGAEILDCYGQHFLENGIDHRRSHLKMKYYFECKCQACSSDWPKKLENNDFRFKCKRCSKQCRKLTSAIECIECGQKIAIGKLNKLLRGSIEKRIAALKMMYDGCYSDALPLLLEHSNCIEKILVEPNLETIKTQQSIIQCLNATSSMSV